jgi:two-component system sensor histidine kinase HydH
VPRGRDRVNPARAVIRAINPRGPACYRRLVDVLPVSALLAALLIVAIGASVLLRDRSDRTYLSFATFTFVVSAWHLATFIEMATGSPWWQWAALWPAASIPPTAIAFFRQFLAQPSIGGPHRPPRVTLAWTLLAYAGLIYGAVVYPVHETDWFLVPFGAYVFGGLYRCVYDMYVQYRAIQKRVERARIRYLALGGFIATTLALTDVLPRFGVAWPTIGNVLSILYLYFISQTLFRSRLIDVNELVGKMAVLGSLVVLLSAVYSLLLSWVGGGQQGIYLLNALVASFVILILFEPVRNRLESGINRWLLRQRTEMRGRLESLRRELQSVVDVPDMIRQITTALEESRRVTDGAVYLLDPDGAGFDRAGYFGAAPIERLEAGAARALLERLRVQHLDREQVQRELAQLPADAPAERREALTAAIATAEQLAAGLVFPFLGTAETEQGPWLLGFLTLRDDRTEGAFDLDDVDVFRALASQAARVIESSQAYERVKERDRLAALGEMSAGLAHEIRNPLGAIKGAAQLLVGPDRRPLPLGPESAEFIDIILEEVDRLNNVVTRFLDYARADRAEGARPGAIDLNAVVKKVAALLASAPEAKAVELKARYDDQLPKVVADPEALVQVFLNLGLNAMQAMPDGGSLDILTTRRRRSRLGYGQFAEVRLRDTGHGIAADKLKKLFIPFYTTKTRGTGLGLAIAQRIVSQCGGTIEVRSTPGAGSTFSVFLPVAPGTPLSATTTGQITNPLRERAEPEPSEPPHR